VPLAVQTIKAWPEGCARARSIFMRPVAAAYPQSPPAKGSETRRDPGHWFCVVVPSLGLVTQRLWMSVWKLFWMS
jgi:hypothetical protein